MEIHMFRILLVFCLFIFAASNVSRSAEIVVVLKATGSNEGGTATVKLNTDDKTWTGTNDSGEALLTTFDGKYVKGPQSNGGFDAVGVGLVIKGKFTNESDWCEAYLYELVPEREEPKTGNALNPRAALSSRWTRQ
jgi:hypothetical protein